MLDNFTVTKVLGQGGSSKVYWVKNEQDQEFAAKVLRKDKNYTYQRGSRVLKTEHCITSKLEDHPNILKSYYTNPDGSFTHGGKSEKAMYNVIEYAENGPLSKFVRITGEIEECLVRFMFSQILNAVSYMHSFGIAHLDLKLENILLDKYFNIKVADLGVAHEDTKHNSKCPHRKGTVIYMAPEVVDLKKGKSYDPFKADIYSLGVCLYVLLIGNLPDKDFISGSSFLTKDSDMDGKQQISQQNEKRSTEKWNCLSDSVKGLIVKMLSSDPKSRPSITELLNHEWLWRDYDEEILSELYSEMVYRKEYIWNYSKRKQNS